MAHDLAGDDDEKGERRDHDAYDDRRRRHDRYHDHDDSHRWPAEAPSVEVARVVVKVDGSITLKRAAAMAWLTAHHHAAPALAIKPTRMELAVVSALAETYGAALYRDTRFAPVLDFIADYGAVKLVQRVMYGARPTTDFDVTAYAAEDARLAELLREARTAFEFLCAAWPEAFMAQASEALEQLGLPRLRTPAPPSTNGQRRGHVGSDDGPGDQPGDELEGGDA